MANVNVHPREHHHVPHSSKNKLQLKMSHESGKEEKEDLSSAPGSPTTIVSRSGHSASWRRTSARSSFRHASHRGGVISQRDSILIDSADESISAELTAQAETKLFALVDLLSSASSQAGSMKDCWTKLLAERTSWVREREILIVRLEESNSLLEQCESSEVEHKQDAEKHKSEIKRLLGELSMAFTAIAEQKKKVGERDSILAQRETEMRDLRLSLTRAKGEHSKILSEIESIQVELDELRDERHTLRQDIEKERTEHRSLKRVEEELRSRNEDLLGRLQLSQQEVAALTERLQDRERERSDMDAERERLKDELRKYVRKSEESARSMSELLDQITQLRKDHDRLKEYNNIAEEEKLNMLLLVEKLRAELKEKISSLEDAEARESSTSSDLEHARRDLAEKDAKIVERDAEVSRLILRLETRDSECGTLISDKNRMSDELEAQRLELNEQKRHSIRDHELLRARDSSLDAVRDELLKAKEKVELLELQRNEFRDKHKQDTASNISLKEDLAAIKFELASLQEARKQHHKDVDGYKEQIEELSCSVTDFQKETAELEFEVQSLRGMLREARLQKEQAITARNAADHERDEAVKSYEEKCREFEAFEDSRRHFLHAHSNRAESRASM